MPEVDVKVTENVTPLLAQVTAKLARGLEHVREPLAAAIRDLFRRRFETQGAYGGTRWPDLNASTMRKLGAHTMLERTGALWDSLTGSSNGYGYTSLSESGRQLAVGSSDPVLRYTELGTRRMPARPVLPDEVPGRELERWADLTADSLLKLE